MNSLKQQFLDIFNTIDFHKIIDHPNILVAARFWENERYEAAKTCYKFMRNIDDLIDNYKAENKIIAPDERKFFTRDVNAWIGIIRDTARNNPVQKELTDTIEHFRIPSWPLEAFARSMLYDINNDGFATIDDFIEYSQGASVAPASIFVHLNSISKKEDGYTDPPFDVRDTATPCALFSYLVHIIRDFQKDQLNNLNYFADDLILKNNLTRSDLLNFAHGAPVNDNFRNLIRTYYSLADKYREQTQNKIQEIRPLLEPRYQLSLEIIFSLYLMVFERIDIINGRFTTMELNPSPDETRERVYKTILDFTS